MAFNFVRYIKGILIQNETDKTKQVSLEISDSATTGTKTTIVASQTSNVTVTTPNTTGQLLVESDLDPLQDQIDEIVTLTGVPSGSTNLGTFTGGVIPDDSDIKEALQSVADAVASGPVTSVSSGTGTSNKVVRFDNDAGTQISKTDVEITGTNGENIRTLTGFVGGTTLSAFGNNSTLPGYVNFYTVARDALTQIRGPDATTDGGHTIVLPDTIGDVDDILKITDVNGSVVTTQWQAPDSGPTFTDWTAFTPTSTFGAGNFVYTGFYRRIGDSLDIKYCIEVTGSTGSGTNLRFDMPSGFTIDTARLPGTTSNNRLPLGEGLFNNGGTQGYAIKAVYYDTDEINVLYMDSGGLTAQFANNAPANLNTGCFIILNCFGVPINE